MEKIRRYVVKNVDGFIMYKCASGHLHDNYVINEIKKRFQYYKKMYRIYRDGEIIHKENTTKQINGKRIKDISSGEIYADIYALADAYDISIIQAKKLIKTKLKYKEMKILNQKMIELNAELDIIKERSIYLRTPIEIIEEYLKNKNKGKDSIER